MAAQAIMLSLRGVPGIYFHSLFGSRNWHQGVQLEKNKRAINRQKLGRIELEQQLADPASLRSLVFRRYQTLLAQRTSSTAFHPHGRQEILDVGRRVFAVLRSSPDGLKRVLCLQNITEETRTVSLPNAVHRLEGYQTLWLVNS
jgi:sucrose phosphorylase